MTHDTVNLEQPGLAVDLEIALKVMGIPKHEWDFVSCFGGAGNFMCRRCDAWYCTPPWTRDELPVLCRVDGIPKYSTDINAAWALIEKFGFMIHPCAAGPDGKPAGYWVGYPLHGIAGLVGTVDNLSVSFAATAPHAICLSALKISEARKSQFPGRVT